MNPHELLDTALAGDPTDALRAIRALREVLAQRQQDHVLTLRRHGANWAFIGRHLGVTRQAAIARYGHWEAPTQR